MRLPPPAIRWPANSGIKATSLCIRSRMTLLTWLRSAETSWIIGSSDGARAGPIEWMEALMSRRLCAVGLRKARARRSPPSAAERQLQPRQQAAEILALLEMDRPAVNL